MGYSGRSRRQYPLPLQKLILAVRDLGLVFSDHRHYSPVADFPAFESFLAARSTQSLHRFRLAQKTDPFSSTNC
jgi:hypothetical protein